MKEAGCPKLLAYSCLLLLLLFFALAPQTMAERMARDIQVGILEGVQESRSWDFARPQAAENFSEPAFGLLHIPVRYTDKGLIADRSDPYMLVASGQLALAPGSYRVWLRSRGAARLLLDGK